MRNTFQIVNRRETNEGMRKNIKKYYRITIKPWLRPSCSLRRVDGSRGFFDQKNKYFPGLPARIHRKLWVVRGFEPWATGLAAVILTLKKQTVTNILSVRAVYACDFSTKFLFGVSCLFAWRLVKGQMFGRGGNKRESDRFWVSGWCHFSARCELSHELWRRKVIHIVISERQVWWSTKIKELSKVKQFMGSSSRSSWVAVGREAFSGWVWLRLNVLASSFRICCSSLVKDVEAECQRLQLRRLKRIPIVDLWSKRKRGMKGISLKTVRVISGWEDISRWLGFDLALFVHSFFSSFELCSILNPWGCVLVDRIFVGGLVLAERSVISPSKNQLRNMAMGQTRVPKRPYWGKESEQTL